MTLHGLEKRYHTLAWKAARAIGAMQSWLLDRKGPKPITPDELVSAALQRRKVDDNYLTWHRVLSYGMDIAKSEGWFIPNACNAEYWERHKAKKGAA